MIPTKYKMFLRQIAYLGAGQRLAKNSLRALKRLSSDHIPKNSKSIIHVTSKCFRNLFCGYYDHSPFHPEDESLIVLHANSQRAWQTPSANHTTHILLVDWAKGRVVRQIGTTTAWNWQQGARAHWLSSDTIIFNLYDAKANSYRAKVVRADCSDFDVLPLPVQESDCRGIVYSISYEALSKIRPDYGYRNKGCTERDIWENRIRSYNISNGIQHEFVGVADLAPKARERHGLPIRLPKLNHVMASPSGHRLIFVFRYVVGNRRVTDLYALDISSERWSCLVPDKGVSHYCWLNNSEILATMKGEDGFGYYRINALTKACDLIWRHSDGHPISIKNGNFVTDSYPDAYGLRNLVAIPLSNPDMAREIASFREPLLFQGETRCDLHASVSVSGKWIQIDMAKGHKRCVGIVPLFNNEANWM